MQAVCGGCASVLPKRPGKSQALSGALGALPRGALWAPRSLFRHDSGVQRRTWGGLPSKVRRLVRRVKEIIPLDSPRPTVARPLPPRAAGESDSQARTKHKHRPDPCQLVWQVNQILHAPTVVSRSCHVRRKNLSHPPHEVAGVASVICCVSSRMNTDRPIHLFSISPYF